MVPPRVLTTKATGDQNGPPSAGSSTSIHSGPWKTGVRGGSTAQPLAATASTSRRFTG
ncbi:MAG: hypothetical protein ACK559_07645 [bacterium]